jgi:hypothetical protein
MGSSSSCDIRKKARAQRLKGRIMKNASRFAIVAAIAMSAVAAQAAGFDFTDGHYPPEEQSHSTLTRAQVLADLEAAKASGEFQAIQDGYHHAMAVGTPSTVSREQVRQETIAANRAGLLDNFGG